MTWTPAAGSNPQTVRNAVLSAVTLGNHTDEPVRFIDHMALVPTGSQGQGLERLRASLKRVDAEHPGTRIDVQPAQVAGKVVARFYRPPADLDTEDAGAYASGPVPAPTRRPLRLLADA